jgi:virulence factor
MKMNQINVGVIGVGRMGQRHSRVFANMRKVQLVGVCDIDVEIGQKVAQEFDVPFYTEIDDLLDRVDAVSIATPTDLHYQQTKYCLGREIHVLLEKPISDSLAEAKELVDIAENSGLVAQVAHIERFNPAYIELKNIVEQTQPLAIEIRRLSPYQGSNIDVDVVLDLMIHDANLALDLVAMDPNEICSHGLTAYSGTIDHAVAQLCFINGPLLTMTASRVTENKVRKIDVTCREAFISCDLLDKNISVHRFTIGEYLKSNHRGVKYRQESIIERINVPIFEPLFLQLQHFVNCIIEQKIPTVTFRDGLKALDLVIKIRDNISQNLINLDRRKISRVG